MGAVNDRTGDALRKHAHREAVGMTHTRKRRRISLSGATVSAIIVGLAGEGMSAPLPLPDPSAAPHAVVASAPTSSKPDTGTRTRISETYGKLPLSFEANQGQTDGRVKFLARGPGYTFFLTPTETVLSLRTEGSGLRTESPTAMRRAVVRMKVVGANAEAKLVGLDELPGKSNYFIGNDPKKWRTGIPHYGKVRYQEVYPGVDLVFYGNPRQLEYDFVVAPGADPQAITLAFEGTDKLEIDSEGNLVLHIAGGHLIQRTPIIYQDIGGTRQPIPGHYVLRDKDRIGVHVASYDRTRPLIIDPVLVYSTFLGSDQTERGNAIAVDATGNTYVTGETNSDNFPGTAGSLIQAARGGGQDAFVTKLNAAGSAIVYSTYLGGGGTDRGLGIAVDGTNRAYVTGVTDSTGATAFPTTAGAFQGALAGGTDAFVTRLNAAGTMLEYSTYYGGAANDQANAIAADTANNAYITGETNSGDFPTSPGAFQAALDTAPDAFVVKLDPAQAGAASRIYSTYLGGGQNDRGFGIAVDGALRAYVTGMTDSTGASPFPTQNPIQGALAGGEDAFVTRLNVAGTALEYSSYHGGNLNDQGNSIVVDAANTAYVTGVTASANFPTTVGAFDTSFNGVQDAFATKFNNTGTALVYSTFVGGAINDIGRGIAIDGVGNAYITGDTLSDDFPTAGSPFQAARAGLQDAFVTKLNATGTGLSYSTYLGGSNPAIDIGRGIAVDPLDNAYVTGETGPAGVVPFPTTAGAFDTTFNDVVDAFIAKIMESPAGAGGGGGGGGGGCFIATAAFGSPLAPQVRLLRDFRDRYLLTNGPGQLFTAAYYRISPPLANLVAESEVLRAIVRAMLVPVIGWTALFMWSPVLGLAIPLACGGLGTRTLVRAIRRRGTRVVQCA